MRQVLHNCCSFVFLNVKCTYCICISICVCMCFLIQNGTTALFIAVEADHLPTVRKLIDKGANVNAVRVCLATRMFVPEFYSWLWMLNSTIEVVIIFQPQVDSDRHLIIKNPTNICGRVLRKRPHLVQNSISG